MKNAHSPHSSPHKPPHPAADAPAVPPPAVEAAEGAGAAPAAPAAPPAPPASPVADLEAKLADLQRQVDDFKDKYLRGRADFDNYRKRIQRDLQDARAAERTATLVPFLQVYDHFVMAQAHAGPAADSAALAEGLRLIAGEFGKALTTLGVERIEAEGKPFDPTFHEAVSAEDSDTVPAGQVLRQFKSGYRVGDQLLRPAAVVVSNGPAAAAAPSPAPATPDPTP
ncbi:MAG: nucleotide exchange factor GrpE [Lentisphaeria bacterium]